MRWDAEATVVPAESRFSFLLFFVSFFFFDFFFVESRFSFYFFDLFPAFLTFSLAASFRFFHEKNTCIGALNILLAQTLLKELYTS